MPLAHLIGVAGPTYEMMVETGKIHEFAHAIKSQNSDYLRLDRPVAPPTFLTVAGNHWGYTLERPGDTIFKDLGIDITLLLHAEEEYEYHGPPPAAGDRLTVQSVIRNAFTKEGRRGGQMVFYVIETSFRDPEGRLVATQRTTAVQTHA